MMRAMAWCVFVSVSRKHLYRNAFSEYASPLPPRGPQKTPLKDWYTLYRTRWSAKYRFRVIYADVGSMTVRYGLLGAQPTVYQPSLVLRCLGCE